jgi:hypothetical protein
VESRAEQGFAERTDGRYLRASARADAMMEDPVTLRMTLFPLLILALVAGAPSLLACGHASGKKRFHV